MLCPRCNNPLEEDAAFCGVCGALIKPKSEGETAFEESDSMSYETRAMPGATVYADHPGTPRQIAPTILAPEYRLADKQPVDQRNRRATLAPPVESLTPFPRKAQNKSTRLFVFLASIAVIVLAVGGIFLFLTSPRLGISATTAAAKGQVSFLDSQNSAPGVTDALKVTATNLPNPADGSRYDAWLIDAASEQILSLGSLSKSDSNTFALSYPNPNTSSATRTNLLGVGNKIEITQEQGEVTVPSGKAVLSATFPPQAFIHVRHLLFKFPTTPSGIGLLPGLVNETQKLSVLSQALQTNASNGSTESVLCVAQAMVNVAEGKNGTNFQPLAARCASLGVGSAVTGDGFGIMQYLSTTATHAALAASQSDTTDTIRLRAKEVTTSTTSIKAVVTQIDNYALQVLANPGTVANLAPDMASASYRAYHGFDQNGNGKIEPVVGEAGALTAYTSGQVMATLTLS